MDLLALFSGTGKFIFMSEMSYNNWLFNKHNNIKNCIYANNLNSYKPKKFLKLNFDEGKHFYFKKDDIKYQNIECRLPILAIRKFIKWIVFHRKEVNVTCNSCKFIIRKITFK